MDFTSRLRRWSAQSVLALGAALCLMLLLSKAAFANTVEITDVAGVLDTTQVFNAAENPDADFRIITIPGFNGTTAQFDAKVASDANMPKTIAIEMDTVTKHVFIAGGKDVGLSSSDYDQAVRDFKNGLGNGDYTNATIDALAYLRGALRNVPSPNSWVFWLVALIVIALGSFANVLIRRAWRKDKLAAAPVYYAPTPYGPQNYGPPPQQGGWSGNPAAAPEGERVSRQEYGGEQGNGGDSNS